MPFVIDQKQGVAIYSSICRKCKKKEDEIDPPTAYER